MKAYGNVITGTVGAQSLDLPTTPAARPSHWPAKRDRTAWTSPIARSLDEAATRRAEQAATQAAVAEAREKDERERRARHAKAAPVKRAPAQRTTSKPVKERAARPQPPEQPRPGHLTPAEVAQLVDEGLAAPVAAPATPPVAPAPAAKPKATPKPQPRKIDDNEAVRLFTVEQRTVAEIARHFGCSHPAVVQRLRKAGVYTTRPARNTGDANGSHRAAVELRERVETDLRALWAEGLPIWAIAVRLNVSETLVKRMASEFDLPRRRKALDPEQITRLYAEHRSIERVAELLDTSSAAIRYQLGKAGVQLRAPGDNGARIPDDVRQAAVDAYRAGVSPVKIRHQYGLGETTLLRFIRDAGVTPRTNGQRGDLPREADEEASPAAPTTREQLLEALLLERFAPPPRKPSRTPRAPAQPLVPLDLLPDIARRRRVLLEATSGRRNHAEEATA